MKKRFLSVLLVLALAFSPAANMNAAPGDIGGYTYDAVAGGELLKAFTLAGSLSDGMINNIELGEKLSAYLWDRKADAFKPVECSKDAIVGNFVELRDIDGDKKADGILIVSWKDSKFYWDSAQHWDMDAFDDGGAFSAGQVWRIPFGERLLEGYGVSGALEDYSNIVDYADLANSTYWPLHDYYGTKSNETLAMLTGFRTTQQATGWACGPTSAIMVMDWFGLRGDLNEEDLAALRQKPAQGGATNLRQMVNIFEGLNDLHKAGIGEWGEWEILSSYDIVEEYEIEKPEGGKYNLMSVDELMDGTMIRAWLEDGKPILIGWNSFGGHWQAIIGYGDMGTEDTKDDVLILADPYDSTDHRNDGYNIQSLERFVYDWSAGFDTDFRHGIFVVAAPKGWEETYEPDMGEGIVEYRKGYDGVGSDDMKLSYGRTAADITKYYPSTPYRGEGNGLAGAATGGYERDMENYINTSPYYAHYNYYGLKSGVSPVSGGELVILEKFKTQQQTTEWTCGLTSVLMAMEWFDGNPSQPKLLKAFSDTELQNVADTYGFDVKELKDDRLTEINLAQLRGEGRTNPGATTLDDMTTIFDKLNADTDYLKAMAVANSWTTVREWAYLTTDDLSEDGFLLDEDGGEHYLVDGLADEGVIPYFIGKGHPVLIGWDEWGGHWQVAIGFDDMDTEDTQDDILILADPYDTTDQNQDGYYLEAFERLVYGWGAAFDARRSEVFIIPYLVDTGIPVDMYGKPVPDIVINSISTGNGQANANFSIHSANGKGYTVYLSDQSEAGVYKAYKDVNYNAKGVHIRGLTNGKTYYAYIEYKESGGKVLTSRVFSFTPSK